eukprot:TRINITY_DN10869_c0_g1_i1.p1 TRINITY_DN10869_c0_g1~~TRINITY_DN10869_c0_g1_i1.p1  ORF type:complete len:237 (-),score=43.35 TRINITY_DN10869_c0_g1_i1:42-719(-)
MEKHILAIISLVTCVVIFGSSYVDADCASQVEIHIGVPAGVQFCYDGECACFRCPIYFDDCTESVPDATVGEFDASRSLVSPTTLIGTKLLLVVDNEENLGAIRYESVSLNAEEYPSLKINFDELSPSNQNKGGWPIKVVINFPVSGAGDSPTAACNGNLDTDIGDAPQSVIFHFTNCLTLGLQNNYTHSVNGDITLIDILGGDKTFELSAPIESIEVLEPPQGS